VRSCSTLHRESQKWNYDHGLYEGIITGKRNHNPTEQSRSWEVQSFSARQENSAVHYPVHNSPPLVPILSQINLLHVVPFYLRPSLILSFHLSPGLPKRSPPFRLPHQNSACIYLTPTGATFPAQLIFCVYYKNIAFWTVQITNSLIMLLSTLSNHFLLLRSKYLPHYPILEHSRPRFLP